MADNDNAIYMDPDTMSQGSGAPPQKTGGDQQKMNRLQRMAQDLDYQNRDPRNINDSCHTLFEDIIGEPEGTHSDDAVWVTVYKAYFAGKICCDACLQYICAVPCSFLWGCCFSMLAFCQIYSATPCVRAFNMCFMCFSKMYATWVYCFCIPVYETCALMFTKIYVTTIDGAEGYKSRSLGSFNQMNKV